MNQPEPSDFFLERIGRPLSASAGRNFDVARSELKDGEKLFAFNRPRALPCTYTAPKEVNKGYYRTLHSGLLICYAFAVHETEIELWKINPQRRAEDYVELQQPDDIQQAI